MEKLVTTTWFSALYFVITIKTGPVETAIIRREACPILDVDPAIWSRAPATVYFCTNASTKATYISSRHCLSQCSTFCQVAKFDRNGQCTSGGNVHPIRSSSDDSPVENSLCSSSSIEDSPSSNSTIKRRGCFVPTNCLNNRCWAGYTACTYNGGAVDDSIVFPFQGAVCSDADGQGIEHGTTYLKTLTAKNGQQIYFAIRNWAPRGRYTLGITECNWLLDPISKPWENFGCQPQGPNTYTQGGYAWFTFSDLTGVIGVDGNNPVDLCGGGC